MLRLLGKIYGLVVDARNEFYERGLLKSHSLGARTISVGNITTGGTGKTPLVAYAAGLLADSGEKVCVLTRGYGRTGPRTCVLVSDEKNILVDARTGGDEPVELARRLIGKAVVIADADRVSAAAWAKDRFSVTAFVLDDGFQHRRVKRDLDIVCVDATDPFGGGHVLPAGKLREPVENIRRAAAVVITRSDLVDSTDDIVDRIRRHHPNASIFVSTNRFTCLTTLDHFLAGERAPLDWSALRRVQKFGGDNEVRVMGFCALGNPDAFQLQLSRAFDDESMNGAFDLTSVRTFPDHHRYSQTDIESLEREAHRSGIHAFIATAKDAVKLKGLKVHLPCFVLEVDVTISESERFRDLVLAASAAPGARHD